MKNPFEKFIILNASGVWCTTKEELKEILMSEADAAIVKTMTLLPREGNPEPRLFVEKEELFSVNSMGLPNKGIDYYCGIVEELKNYKKPVFASVAGFSKDEFYELVSKADKADFDAIEINLSCPNVESSSLFAYDFDLVEEICKNARKLSHKFLGVKLPPYPERWQIKKMADILVRNKIDFVSLCNSWPLGCAVDIEKDTTTIHPNQGIGGLGGKFFKYIVLGQVRLFYQNFNGRLKIIAVGGVTSGKDVFEYALAGANGVGMGTALLANGPSVLSKIKKEIDDILEQKNLPNLESAVGRLKNL